MSSPRERTYVRAVADRLVADRGDRVAHHYAVEREGAAEIDLVRDLLADSACVDVGGELRHRRSVADDLAGYRLGLRNRRGWSS